MRQSKYRIWDKQEQKWLSPCNVRVDGNGQLYYLTQYGYEDWTNDDFEICFWIGMKDKNNIDLYEGDIVKEGYCQGISEIVFCDGCFFTKELSDDWETFSKECVDTHEECMTFIHGRCDDFEIIGNIYENPELLTKK